MIVVELYGKRERLTRRRGPWQSRRERRERAVDDEESPKLIDFSSIKFERNSLEFLFLNLKFFFQSQINQYLFLFQDLKFFF